MVFPFTSDYPLLLVRYTGDGTQDDFTLPYAPGAATAANIRVRIDGVLATFTTHFTVTGSVITFTEGNIPGNGAKIVVTLRTQSVGESIRMTFTEHFHAPVYQRHSRIPRGRACMAHSLPHLV